jgi:hypothetical protein
VAGGVALGTAQWLPGLLFLSQSQRSSASYSYFTSGSLDNRLLTLVASPFVLGTNQGWPGPYSGSYNFPEVTSYVGILALIAGCTLLLKRWRTRPEARQWWVWYVILVIGLLSALGTETPFAHLMYLIPGVSSERLLNRTCSWPGGPTSCWPTGPQGQGAHPSRGRFASGGGPGDGPRRWPLWRPSSSSP